MLVLGINSSFHDSSAVLARNCVVTAALEEERRNRVKHTPAFPIHAIRFCLDHAGVSFKDLDFIAFNLAEESIAQDIDGQAHSQLAPRTLSPRTHLARLCADAGLTVRFDQLRFVTHHLAHAASAMLCSGFEEAVVLSLDGIGEDSELPAASGVAYHARGAEFGRLRTIAPEQSLGFLYGQVTKLLGFQEFDEYKVMGLAPFGNPETYRAMFTNCCALMPEGRYQYDRLRLVKALYKILHDASRSLARRDQARKDIAAACQESLERVVLHILADLRRRTGLRQLAMAGGVALNCTLNMKIADSGLFDEFFVQPASHDAGGALGAALLVSAQEQAKRGAFVNRRMTSVSWGTPLPSGAEIERALQAWKGFVCWRRCENIAEVAAERLAGGAIVGWVQSRSEFGPRALGYRSILADPREAENLHRVNKAVKKREGFRPLAPSVAEEKAGDYFELPASARSLPFMLFVVRVRPEARNSLAAVTHVDGTARVQTVSRQENPKYWELLQEFGKRTGVYALLNTSFNNSAEPIVDTVEDALTAFVTTGLDSLIVGDYLVSKEEVTDDLLLDSEVEVAPCGEIGCTATAGQVIAWARYRYEVPLAARKDVVLDRATFNLFSQGSGGKSLRKILCNADSEERATVLSDIRKLWWLRLIRLTPPGAAAEDLEEQASFLEVH
jgi:carbamoyltransferase